MHTFKFEYVNITRLLIEGYIKMSKYKWWDKKNFIYDVYSSLEASFRHVDFKNLLFSSSHKHFSSPLLVYPS